MLRRKLFVHKAILGFILLAMAVSLTIHSSNVFAADTPDSPLVVATRAKDLFKMEELIKADKKLGGENGGKALKTAIQVDCEPCADLLIRSKVNVNFQDKFGETALMNVSGSGQMGLVKTLLSAKANPNLKDNGGETALMRATKANNIEVVGLLLEAKADVNASSRVGITALMWAAEKGNAYIVKLLLATKANTNATDSDKSTAMSRASKFGHFDIVNLLKLSGAKT